ncbi:MAG TPA: hypothetical protein VIK65_04985 [Candidatus Limnocylindrales bacterium]
MTAPTNGAQSAAPIGRPGTSGGVAAGSHAARIAAVAARTLPIALVVVGEAAWISVLAGLTQELALRDPVLGVPAYAGFVLVGFVFATVIGPRLGGLRPIVLFGLIVASGAIGWLCSPVARASLSDGIAPAIAGHPAGWFAAVAVARGLADARHPLSEDALDRRLAIGVPTLALAAMAGGLITEPFRSRFLADSLGASMLFIAAEVLAIAFARLETLGLESAFEWRHNPAWLGASIALLTAAVAIAVPAASIVASAVPWLLALAIAPVVIVALVADRRTTVWSAAAFALLGLVLVLLVRLLGNDVPVRLPPLTGGVGIPTPTAGAAPPATLDVGTLLFLGSIAVAVVVIGLWLRKAPPPQRTFAEMRTIDTRVRESDPKRPRPRLGRRAAPVTAAEAYVALLDELRHDPDAERRLGETPAAHAARLRAADRAGLKLDLLAADYALSSFAGVRLSEGEQRRGIARWRVLRDGLIDRRSRS